jgi:hypothetical protein
MIDPADLIVSRKIVDSAHCPEKDCPVSMTEEREQGSSEELTTVGGYVRGKLIKAMTDHMEMAHNDQS